MSGLMLSKVSVQDFVDLLHKLEGQLPETIPEFPLEYFVGLNTVRLYKQIACKTYCAEVVINEQDGTVFFKGNVISFEEFLNDLRVNHKGLELLEGLEGSRTVVRVSEESI